MIFMKELTGQMIQERQNAKLLSHQRQCQRVCTAGDLRPHQGIFRMKKRRIDLFQSIPAQIIIAVPGGAEQAGFRNPALLHGGSHLELVVLCGLVNLPKTLRQRGKGFFSKPDHRFRNAKPRIWYTRAGTGADEQSAPRR